MNKIYGVEARTAAQLLAGVAQSMKNQEQGISRGHVYLKIRNDRLEATPGSWGKISFKTVSEVFQHVMESENLTSAEKHKALGAYKIIAQKYGTKEGLFIGPFERNVQKKEAKNLIIQARRWEEAERGKIVELKSYIDGQFARLDNDFSKNAKILEDLRQKLKVSYPEVIAQLNWDASQLEGISSIRSVIQDLKEHLDANYEVDGCHKEVRKQEIQELKSFVAQQSAKLGRNPSDEDVKKLMWGLRHGYWDVISILDRPKPETERFEHEAFSQQMQPEVTLTRQKKQEFMSIFNSIKDCLGTKYEPDGSHRSEAISLHRNRPIPQENVIISSRAKKQRQEIVELRRYIAGQFARLGNKPIDFEKDAKILKELMAKLQVRFPEVIAQLNWTAVQKKNFEKASKLEGTTGVISSGQYTKKYIASEKERVLRAIQDLKEYLDQKFDSNGEPIR